MRGVVKTKVALTWIIWCLHCASNCSAQTLLLATDGGIMILEPVTSALTTVHEHPASSVDFRFDKKDVYFISNNQILYSYYSEYIGSHAEPIPIITAPQMLVDLVVDWRDFRLYYTGSDTGAIYEGALLGATIVPITVKEGASVTDIALDVIDRRFFYIKDDTLYSFQHTRETPPHHTVFNFTIDPHRISSVSKVAVDHHKRDVYVVGYDEEHMQWHLVSTDYNNSYSTLVFNGPELAQPFALGVFDGKVLWGSVAQGKYTIYSCELSPACDIDRLEIVYQSVEAIHDVKFYNALIQTPDSQTACEELACSHNCTVVSLYTVRCSCPPGLSVEPGGNICTEDPPEIDFTVWVLEVKKFLAALADALLRWLSSQSSQITLLILIACAIMLMLLTCGLCLLLCARKPKRSVRLSEAYDLSETRHRADGSASRDSNG